MQGPRGSAALQPFCSVLSGIVRTAPRLALGVRVEAKGYVAVVWVDVGKKWGTVCAGDVSGALGHVDEAQDVWAGRKGL